MKIAYDIDWDVDDGADLMGLPTMANIPDNISDDDVADYLSDTFSFCVNSFRLKEAETQEYKFSHTYMAKVTHEVTFTLPAGLTDAQAKDFFMKNNITPDNTESTDEEFIEDVDWYRI